MPGQEPTALNGPDAAQLRHAASISTSFISAALDVRTSRRDGAQELRLAQQGVRHLRQEASQSHSVLAQHTWFFRQGVGVHLRRLKGGWVWWKEQQQFLPVSRDRAHGFQRRNFRTAVLLVRPGAPPPRQLSKHARDIFTVESGTLAGEEI